MEDHSSLSLPHNVIRRAFHHFSALREYDYSYSCVRCGHSPPILIADANWKVAFDLPGWSNDGVLYVYTFIFMQVVSLQRMLYCHIPVHLFKRPSKENITSQDTEVNVRDRWQTLEKRIVASGFCYGKNYRKDYDDYIYYITPEMLL